jgi:hypothetical protein
LAISQLFFFAFIFFYQLFLIYLPNINLKDNFMTHSEDVPRFRSAEQNQEFLLFRIDALQKRVEFLEAQSEINLVELYNQNK